jgi:hypothetical protein
MEIDQRARPCADTLTAFACHAKVRVPWQVTNHPRAHAGIGKGRRDAVD